MSDWFEDRISRRQAEQQRALLISGSIDALWENLCLAIGTLIERYENTYRDEKIDWNGPEATAIWIKVGLRSKRLSQTMTEENNRLDLKLERNKKLVSFRYKKSCRGKSGGSLRVGVNSDGQASFLDDTGQPVSIERAVEIIMDPFLFSDIVEG